MSIKDCREGDLESITVVGNMEDSTMKVNQNGVLTIAENEAAESISGNKVKRSRKLTEKGLQYKLEQLKTKREKINAKLLRKSGMMNDMLYSFTNASAVAEEMEQFNDMLKLFTAVNDEYQHLLKEDELLADSQWFEEQDERIFSFKHKIIKWLKEAELNKEEERSRKSVGSRSSKSRSSKSSRSSNRSSRSSIKDKAIEEKIKIAELIAESNFTDQKLKMEYEAKRLEMEEKVAKAQARAKILDLLDMPPLEGEEDAKGRNIVHNKQMTDTNIALDRQHENWKEFIPGKKYHYSNSLFRNGEPSYTPSDHNSQSGEVSKMLCQLLKQQGAPEVEIDVFSGDPLEYHYFM